MVEADAANATVNYEALDALKSVLGLEFAGLVRDFNEQMASGLVRLELAIARRDARRISAVAHTLKGSALSLHCKALAECCGRVERGAALLVQSGKDDLLEELRDSVRSAVSAIDDWAS
ncbi:MAG: Hpt domain-containing protein [Pseudomonadales bacterium]